MCPCLETNQLTACLSGLCSQLAVILEGAVINTWMLIHITVLTWDFFWNTVLKSALYARESKWQDISELELQARVRDFLV